MLLETEVEPVLPPAGFLHDYVRYAAANTDSNASYHILGGLACIAQTVPIDYHMDFGGVMPTHIFGLSVGASSSSRKSAAIGIARKLLEEALPGSVGEIPGSKENLVESLRSTPRQVIMYPEFGSFLSQAERGYLNPLKTAFTEAWDGTPLGRGLVKKKDTLAQTPRMSLLAGSTLEYLERHTEPADWTGGFLARFICMYGNRIRTWKVPPGAPHMRPILIARLQEMAGSAVLGATVGRCLGFDGTARAMWDAWYDTLEEHERTASEATKGAVARAHAHALRVAMLLAWDYGYARSGYDWYVTPAELGPAINIIGLHIKSVLAIGRNLAGSKDMRERRAVLNCIGEQPVPLGEVLQHSQLLLRRVKEILESLLEEGAVVRAQDADLAAVCYRRPTAEERANRYRPQKGVEFPLPDNVVRFPTPHTSGASNGSPSVPSGSTSSNGGSWTFSGGGFEGGGGEN